MKVYGNQVLRKDRVFFIIFNKLRNIQVNLLIITDKAKGRWTMNLEKVTKDSLMIIKEKDMVWLHIKTNLFMKVNGETIFKKAMVRFSTKQIMSHIKVIGNKASFMVKENIYFKINLFIKEILNLERLVDLVWCDITMVLSIKEIGKTNRKQDKEYINMEMVIIIKGNGYKIKDMVMEICELLINY